MVFQIIIDTIFGAALFINAILFIPQALKIYQQKQADSISLTMFFGFLLIQLSAVLYGVVHNDMLLIWGYLLSMICCGSVIVLAAIYRNSPNPNENSPHIHLLEDIIAKMPGNVYWVDTNSVYQGCNDNMAKLAGLSTNHDICGKRNADLPWNLDKPELAQQLDEANCQVMSLGKALTIEEPGTAADGTPLMYLSNKVPLKDEQGLVVGMVGISTDITDRKKMEEDLLTAKEAAEAASHAKTEFIANMGHDIRTPLTGIIGFSQYLAEEIQNPERRACAKQICESGEQLLGLLNGVLDLISADSTHEDSLTQESFDVRRVIHDVLQLELPAVKARHIEIKEHFEETIPRYVIGDKMKLHRILLNLVGNAIKFTEKGYIELSIRLQALNNDTAELIFAVKDTGIGIPDDLQKKVFDRFFKVSPSYKGIYTGNGIGLHIAQKYIGLLGGSIGLESKLGVGTTFSFVLPMKLGEKPAEEKVEQGPILVAEAPKQKQTRLAEPTNTIQSSEAALRVLLVEDNAPAMAVLKMIMNKFDVVTTAAVDAEKAFEIIQKQPFDLLITDLGLPNKQGDELSRMIRVYEQQQGKKPMKIVALTGHAIGEISKTCIEAGMNEVYRKPMTQDALQKLLTPLITTPSQTSAVKASLGPDLPDSEEELFEIDKHPLLDLKVAESLLGSMDVVHEIFKTFKKDGIDADLIQIKVAHDKQDWEMVQKLAHKMKGGAVYGTVRLHHAFLYMERYLKAGHTQCLEQLYTQMLKVIDETLEHIDKWLNNKN